MLRPGSSDAITMMVRNVLPATFEDHVEACIFAGCLGPHWSELLQALDKHLGAPVVREACEDGVGRRRDRCMRFNGLAQVRLLCRGRDTGVRKDKPAPPLA